jgi:AraC family transcriptional regulator
MMRNGSKMGRPVAQSGFHGQEWKELLHLRDTPSSLITRSVRGCEVSVTETRDDNPVPGPCGVVVPEDAYFFSLKLRDYGDCEYWEYGRCVAKPDIRAGETYIYDMKCEPRYVIDKPFHSINFYVPASALNRIAGQFGVRRVDQLDYQYGTGFGDSIVHHIGASLLHGLRRPSEANQLFVDHMMLAFTAHVAQTYGGLRKAEPLRRGLAPWQTKRACEKLASDPGGRLTLQEIAAELDLSVSHFSRAFRASVGLPPHQWLLRQRVDAAKQLMTNRGLSLAEVAIAVGFANQSHFTRVFSAIAGISPGEWRREAQGLPEREA